MTTPIFIRILLAIFILALLPFRSGAANPAFIPQTQPADGISGDHALLHGLIGLNGKAGYAAFQVRKAGARRWVAHTPWQKIARGQTNVSFSAAVSGLLPDTDYQVRAIALVNAVRRNGNEISFRSTPPGPTAITGGAENITAASATLNGTVNTHGVASTIFFFEWGTSTNYGFNATVTVAGGTTAQAAQAIISNLLSQSTYHFRAVASNQWGMGFGGDAIFTTKLSTNYDAAIAGAIAAGGTVTFPDDGIYYLSNTAIVTNSLTLDGSGHHVTLSGSNAVRLFAVSPGAALRLTNVTLAFGFAAATNSLGLLGSASGGAIFTEGTVFADSCRFFSNSVLGGMPYQNDSRGGAIFAADGVVQLRRCEFRNNAASGGIADGGAVCSSNAIVSIFESTFAGNSTIGHHAIHPERYSGHGRGGAIFNQTGVLSINDCTFSSNFAVGWSGYEFSHVGNCCALDGDGLGGAIWNGGNAALTNCTLAENTAGFYNSGFSGHFFRPLPLVAGGGIFNTGQCSLQFSTVAGNRLSGFLDNRAFSGGGCFTTNGTFVVGSTIFSWNAGPVFQSIAGVLQDSGYNICSDASGNFTGPGSRNSTDPLIGLLGDNGGSTFTYSLLPGSPAINSANPTSFPATDQRGLARPQGPAPDIGAFERQSCCLKGK